MKIQIVTTCEQSQRLLRCGVSADTADMCYQFIDECVNNTDNPICNTPKEQFDTIRGYGFGNYRIHITPAWSLSALLGLLPKRIKRGDCSDYTLSLSCDGCFWDLEYTYARYCGEDDSLVLFEDADPIEVCVKAIEWLTENNYKLNEQ